MEKSEPIRSSVPAVLAKIGQFAFGTIAGAITGWSMFFLYDAVAADAPGDLLVPSLVAVVLGGLAALWKPTRLLGLGIMTGSLSQAIFFAWLFSTFFD